MVQTGRYEKVRPLEKKPSDYMRENFFVTTSGMAWEPAIMYARQVLGADRVLYAMDYPYQYVIEEVEVDDAEWAGLWYAGQYDCFATASAGEGRGDGGCGDSAGRSVRMRKRRSRATHRFRDLLARAAVVAGVREEGARHG